MGKLLKRNDVGKRRILSSIPFLKNSAKNDDNIDRAKKNNTTTSQNTTSMSNDFVTVLQQLREFVIGQDEYIDDLCKAFQRPFFIDNGK